MLLLKNFLVLSSLAREESFQKPLAIPFERIVVVNVACDLLMMISELIMISLRYSVK